MKVLKPEFILLCVVVLKVVMVEVRLTDKWLKGFMLLVRILCVSSHRCFSSSIPNRFAELRKLVSRHSLYISPNPVCPLYYSRWSLAQTSFPFYLEVHLLYIFIVYFSSRHFSCKTHLSPVVFLPSFLWSLLLPLLCSITPSPSFSLTRLVRLFSSAALHFLPTSISHLQLLHCNFFPPSFLSPLYFSLILLFLQPSFPVPLPHPLFPIVHFSVSIFTIVFLSFPPPSFFTCLLPARPSKITLFYLSSRFPPLN